MIELLCTAIGRRFKARVKQIASAVPLTIGIERPSADDAQAVSWFQKAAEAGDAHGMANLGFMYTNGRGVAQDYQKAREWYQKAADAGNTWAKNALLRLPSQ
jgi:TPR repeat protein